MSALLKAGFGAELGALRAQAGGRKVIGVCRHDLKHGLGVRLPVGGQVQYPARHLFLGKERHVFRLDDAAFMVFLFMPRVGEENLDAIERCIWDLLSENVERIFTHEAQVGESVGGYIGQGPTNTGQVHLNANEVALGRLLCHGDEGVAHTKANFQSYGRGAAKNVLKIKRLAVGGKAILWPERFEGLLLTGCDSAGAHHKGANGSFKFSHANTAHAQLG